MQYILNVLFYSTIWSHLPYGKSSYMSPSYILFIYFQWMDWRQRFHLQLIHHLPLQVRCLPHRKPKLCLYLEPVQRPLQIHPQHYLTLHHQPPERGSILYTQGARSTPPPTSHAVARSKGDRNSRGDALRLTFTAC